MNNYQDTLSTTIKLLKENQKRANYVTFARLIFAVTFFYLLFFISRNGASTVLIIMCFSSLLTFLFFVKYDQKLLKKNEYNQSLMNVCQDELSAAKGIIHQFEDGIEYENKNHLFSFDLDVFGNKSLFQVLNRCFTKGGKDMLAQYLNTPLLDKEKIISRQKSIQELKIKIEFRVGFFAMGKLLNKSEDKIQDIKNWLLIDDINYFQKFRVFLWVIPIFNIITVCLLISSIITIQHYVFITIAQLLITKLGQNKIKKAYFNSCQSIPQLKGYIEIFNLIEQERFDTYLLTKLPIISQQLRKLVAIGDAFSLRNNVIGGIILNSIFFWDYQCAYRFEVWKKKNAKDLLQAFDVLYEFETLSGIASFYDANAKYVFPEISESIIFNSSKLGHPLIKRENMVQNDFQIDTDNHFFIVTGANMAGKSTFLRAIGVNLILAMIGSPVCAESFVFKPMPIFTCMRIDDSISDGKSYFHAELSRLKGIIQLLEQNQYLFIILDELLKGTNSVDKLRGSELFLEKLIKYEKCHGLIATHDLALTNMAFRFPNEIKNICFEVKIENEIMSFDYKLHEGVTQNMNAIFLMKQMQII